MFQNIENSAAELRKCFYRHFSAKVKNEFCRIFEMTAELWRKVCLISETILQNFRTLFFKHLDMFCRIFNNTAEKWEVREKLKRTLMRSPWVLSRFYLQTWEVKCTALRRAVIAKTRTVLDLPALAKSLKIQKQVLLRWQWQSFSPRSPRRWDEDTVQG